MMKRGFSADDAATKVSESLMTQLSVPVGLLRARPWMPFWRWTAFNLPMQYQGVLQRPRVIMRLSHLMGSLQSNYENPDNLLIPSWLLGVPHVLLGREPMSGQYQYYSLGGWIPSLDALEMLDPRNLDRTVTGLLTPVLTTGIEQLANQNIYFERPVDRFAGISQRATQVETFMGVNMKSRVANVLKKVRLLREASTLTKNDPLEFLESEAEKNERARRRGLIRRELSKESFVLSVFSSGFGVMPKLYHIDLDRNQQLVVWRVREGVEEMKSVYRYGRRQVTQKAREAQLRQMMNPLFEEIPGFRTRPVDWMQPAVVDQLRRYAGIEEGE